MKFLKKIGIVLLIFMGILAIIIGVHFGIEKYTEHKNNSKLMGGFEIQDAKDYKETWENTVSDINGMSLWDKYEAGLAINDGSDTDGDGLTDKDEIEVYGSDPLKISSAGDLYTDGYKVEHNMDVNQYYEFDGEMSFPYNECSEVILSAETPTDFNTVVKRIESTSSLNGSKIYAQYKIYNYSGLVSIELAEILSANNIEIDTVNIYVSDGADVKKYDYSTDGTTVSLKKKLQTEYEYYIYITEKDFGCTASILFGGTVKVEEVSEENVTGAGLVLDSPPLNVFGIPVQIYYEDLGDEETSEILKQKILSQAKDLVGDEDKYYSETHIQSDSAIDIKAKYEILNKVVPFFDITNKSDDEIELIHLLFFFYSYEDRNTYLASKAQEDAEEEITGFVINELPFSNFKSDIGKTGNCAGISHLTAYLYNTENYDESGFYTQDGYDIAWNISNDEGNTTLMNPGLYDYKTTSFVEDNSSGDNYISADSLSEGEYEFVKMIGCAYLSGNKKANDLYQYTYGGANGNHVYDYALIEEMMAQIDSGKILDVYFSMNDGTGHTVNIYDYEIDSADNNVTWFSVYDSNFPRNNTGNFEVSDSGFKLRVEKRQKTVGSGETFGYTYSPLANNSYGATSNRSVNSTPMILVLDENWNDINPIKLVQDNTAEFTIAEDNNSFSHTKSSFYLSDEDAEYQIDEEYYNLLTAHSDSNEKKLIQKKEKEEWGGSCYGIASTMGLFFNGEIGAFDLTDGDATTYYDIGKPCDDAKLRNMINYYQLSQYLTVGDSSIAVSKTYNKSGIIKGIANLGEDGDSIADFLKKLVEHTQDEPALLEFSYQHHGLAVFEGFIGGHAILALECTEGEDNYIITLYDENKISEKIEMIVAKDFQSFSFVDGNGNEINQDNYVSMKFKDFETLYDAVNDGSSVKNNDTTIVFASDSEFEIEKADGSNLMVKADSISGDISVNCFDVVAKDNRGYSADIIITTDDSESYVIKPTSETIDLIVSTDENFYSITGSDIDTIVLENGIIEVGGKNYSFDISIASNTDESSTSLVSYSGDGNGKINVTTEKGKILIFGDEDINNLTAYNYDNGKTYDNLKKNKDGEYVVSAGTIGQILREDWWLGVVIVVVIVVCIILVYKKVKK